jgi:hypothetical protein
MWPWEHAAVAYLCYWLAIDRHAEHPDDASTVAVVLGSQFPDLVDKPLSWGLGVLPSGHSLAHSMLVAGPLVALAVVLARRYRREPVGIAFGIGYLSHLPGDVFYPVALGGEPSTRFLLWPLVAVEPYAERGIGARLDMVAGTVTELLAGPGVLLYLLADLVLVSAALFVWYRRGCPGLRVVGRWLVGAAARLPE